MFNSVKLTVYDIFGYLFPGLVLLSSLGIILWSVFFPNIPLSIVDIQTELWLLLFIIAYYFGHFSQAMANLAGKLIDEETRFERLKSKNIPADIENSVRSTLAGYTGLSTDVISDEWVFWMSDEFVLQYGENNEREIYEYRSGFYRGSAVSFFFLTLAFLARAIAPGGAIKIAEINWYLGWKISLFLAALALVATGLSIFRYWRFEIHRAKHSITSFVMLYPKARRTDE